MKIFVDFDGVIINHKDYPTREDWWKDKPMPGAKEVLNFWLSQTHGLSITVPNHHIKIFTARNPEDWGKVREWLDKYGFPKLPITNIKETGVDIFIDDRAYRFTNWMDISKLIK